jgi:hypothetical protein
MIDEERKIKMNITRSEFFKKLVVSAISFTGVVAFLEACGGNEEKQEKQKKVNDPCNDLSGMSQADIQTREQFEYVVPTPDKNKTCLNCAHFHPAVQGKVCGTCELVKGPINANGYCNQWFIKV